MLIQVGENEILYDDATRIRDAATTAGVNVAFDSWRHGIHVWPVFISAGQHDPPPPSNAWRPAVHPSRPTGCSTCSSTGWSPPDEQNRVNTRRTCGCDSGRFGPVGSARHIGWGSVVGAVSDPTFGTLTTVFDLPAGFTEQFTRNIAKSAAFGCTS
jgi:hypothetical protein